MLQVGIILLAYESYRLTRGAIDGPQTTSVALANANWIIHLERSLHLGIEHGTQSFSERVWGLRDVSAFLYINVQTTVTFTAMAYVYVRHTPAFDFVRDVFIGTWALAIVGFLLVPTAPPRLVAGSGLDDTVAIFTGIDPTTPKVSQFFNPYAALPSLARGGRDHRGRLARATVAAAGGPDRLGAVSAACHVHRDGHGQSLSRRCRRWRVGGRCRRYRRVAARTPAARRLAVGEAGAPAAVTVSPRSAGVADRSRSAPRPARARPRRWPLRRHRQ